MAPEEDDEFYFDNFGNSTWEDDMKFDFKVMPSSRGRGQLLDKKTNLILPKCICRDLGLDENDIYYSYSKVKPHVNGLIVPKPSRPGRLAANAAVSSIENTIKEHTSEFIKSTSGKDFESKLVCKSRIKKKKSGHRSSHSDTEAFGGTIRLRRVNDSYKPGHSDSENVEELEKAGLGLLEAQKQEKDRKEDAERLLKFIEDCEKSTKSGSTGSKSNLSLVNLEVCDGANKVIEEVASECSVPNLVESEAIIEPENEHLGEDIKNNYCKLSTSDATDAKQMADDTADESAVEDFGEVKNDHIVLPCDCNGAKEERIDLADNEVCLTQSFSLESDPTDFKNSKNDHVVLLCDSKGATEEERVHLEDNDVCLTKSTSLDLDPTEPFLLNLSSSQMQMHQDSLMVQKPLPNIPGFSIVKQSSSKNSSAAATASLGSSYSKWSAGDISPPSFYGHNNMNNVQTPLPISVHSQQPLPPIVGPRHQHPPVHLQPIALPALSPVMGHQIMMPPLIHHQVPQYHQASPLVVPAAAIRQPYNIFLPPYMQSPPLQQEQQQKQEQQPSSPQKKQPQQQQGFNFSSFLNPDARAFHLNSLNPNAREFNFGRSSFSTMEVRSSGPNFNMEADFPCLPSSQKNESSTKDSSPKTFLTSVENVTENGLSDLDRCLMINNIPLTYSDSEIENLLKSFGEIKNMVIEVREDSKSVHFCVNDENACLIIDCLDDEIVTDEQETRLQVLQLSDGF